MIIILDDIGGSKSRDGARARTRTGTPTFFLDQTEARRAEKNDFRSRISLLSLSLGQSNNEEFKFATWKTRRELEPKCVPQKLLGSLLGMRRSAIGRPSNIPRSLCERKSTQFLSRFLSGESPQPPCDKKRPLQRKGHAEWRLPLKVITTKKIQNIHQVNQARLIHKSVCRLIAIYNKLFHFYISYLKLSTSKKIHLLKFFSH